MTRHPLFPWITETKGGAVITCDRHERPEFLQYPTGTGMHTDMFTAMKHAFRMEHKNCRTLKNSKDVH